MNASTKLTPDPRVASVWKLEDIKNLRPASSEASPQIALLCYPDDEGVRLNKGRAGAKAGPDRILYYLGRMALRRSWKGSLVVLKNRSKLKRLKDRHEQALEWASEVHQKSWRLITLGGGHDYAYADCSAYFHQYKAPILNVDAHLDLRPVESGKLNSGTGFRRFLEKYPYAKLIEVGLQPQANADEHLEWARRHQVELHWWNQDWPRLQGPVGLSVCLDAFAGLRGVSAPAMVGLSLEEGVKIVDHYREQSSWLGLYECAPKWDPLNEDSARYAALLIYQYVFGPHLRLAR